MTWVNDAAGVAQGVRREFDTLFRTQAERIMRDLDVVTREEFEAIKEMAQLAREENEKLKVKAGLLEGSVLTAKAVSDQLAKLRASVVNMRALADVARGLGPLGLGPYLLLGKGEETTGGRDKGRYAIVARKASEA